MVQSGRHLLYDEADLNEDDMSVAEKTVKNYVTSVLSKMGMARRTEAAVYAVRHESPGPQRS